MPQMSPYNWLLLNFLFSLMLFMFLFILNFISIKKLFFNKNKIPLNFIIKW